MLHPACPNESVPVPGLQFVPTVNGATVFCAIFYKDNIIFAF